MTVLSLPVVRKKEDENKSTANLFQSCVSTNNFSLPLVSLFCFFFFHSFLFFFFVFLLYCSLPSRSPFFSFLLLISSSSTYSRYNPMNYCFVEKSLYHSVDMGGFEIFQNFLFFSISVKTVTFYNGHVYGMN